jgi:predicted MFS family arabinose efflux permease
VLVSGGLALIGTGLALLTLLEADSSWWLFLPGLLVAMVGTGMLNPSVSQVALSSLPPEQSGLAAGANDMFRQAGIAVGVAALGALVSNGETYVDGFHTALWVGTAVALTAAVATAALIRPPRLLLTPAAAAA